MHFSPPAIISSINASLTVARGQGYSVAMLHFPCRLRPLSCDATTIAWRNEARGQGPWSLGRKADVLRDASCPDRATGTQYSTLTEPSPQSSPIPADCSARGDGHMASFTNDETDVANTTPAGPYITELRLLGNHGVTASTLSIRSALYHHKIASDRTLASAGA